jgi:hypothetical protein
MTPMITQYLLQTLLGAGGGWLGNMLKSNGLGAIGNVLAGAVGGNVLPGILGAVAPALMGAAADGSGNSMISTIISGLVGGSAGSLLGGLIGGKKA